MKTLGKVTLGIVGLVGGSLIGGAYYIKSGTTPTAAGSKFYIRFPEETKLGKALETLEGKGVIRSANAMGWYAKLNKKVRPVPKGTYEVWAGVEADELLTLLRKPVRNMFRIPETNLSYRTANLLAKSDIAEAEDYKSLIKSPSSFKDAIKFALPKDSLEGYLYPDTYDLPPLMGAQEVIERQLRAFELKVAPLLKRPEKTRAILTIASLVEPEAGVDHERAIIAGVIYNRLSKGMKLQIDATVLYALGEWRRLYNKDYTSTISPYNTYLHPGLPPGPICSPSLKSVQAALKPATHGFLYYVAKPDRTSLFARTYDEHLRNVAVARKLRDAGSMP